MLEDVLKKRKLNFNDIVEIQSVLNTKSDPKNPNWTDERTVVDYKLAGIFEFVELVESTPWKWWKGGVADIWNIKIEAIDMLHFLSSNIILNKTELSDFDKNSYLGFDSNVTYNLFLDSNPDSGVDRQIAFDVIKEIVNQDESFESINKMIKLCGLTSDEISSIYIAKYTLNEIRWEGGYSLNQYKKIREGYVDENGVKIDGVEDNVFLKKLVDEFNLNKSMSLGDLRNNVFKLLR